MNNEKYLSVKWNNILTITLGLPTIILGIAGFTNPIFSEFWDFISMAIVGALY